MYARGFNLMNRSKIIIHSIAVLLGIYRVRCQKARHVFMQEVFDGFLVFKAVCCTSQNKKRSFLIIKARLTSVSTFEILATKG